MRRRVEAWFVRAMKTTIQTTTIQTTSGFSRVSKRSGECRYRRAKKDFTSSSSSESSSSSSGKKTCRGDLLWRGVPERRRKK